MGLYRREWKDKHGKSHRLKTWWMSYTVPGIGQKCESTGTANKVRAQQRLDIRLAAIHEGRFSGLLKSHPPTLKTYLAEYLESRTDLHPNTRIRYGVSIRSLQSFFASTKLPDVTDGRIQDYTAARLRGSTGPTGINRDLSLLRLVLKQARRDRYIAQNPLDSSDFYLNEKAARIQARPFTLDEEQRLLAVATGYLHPLLMLLLDTGLRPNAEALTLKWKDIDFESGMIGVVSSKTRAGLRSVPMTARLRSELQRWKKLTGRSSDFVFFHPRNPANHLLHIPKTWATALKDAKIAKRRLYDCRSTFCSRMYAAGVQPVVIESLMGHTSGLVHRYAKLDDDARRSAAERLEGFITSKLSNQHIPDAAAKWVN